MNNQKGFTLVEMLVAITIFAVVGTISLSIFFITLRTSNKSDVLLSLRQNGNVAMSQITKNIRYAKSLDYPSSCIPTSTTPSITITSVLDDAKTTFSCDLGPPSTIASNGASLFDTTAVTVRTCYFTCSQTTLNDPPIINFGFSLIPSNSNQLVESTGVITFQTSVTMRNLTR